MISQFSEKKIKYNVLHIITKLELGGAQQNTLYTLKKLNKDIFNCFLITGSYGLLIKEAKKLKKVKLYILPFLKREILPFYDFLALIGIYQFIKKNQIDIVHTHSSKAGILGRLAAWLAKTKLIIHTIHGFSFYNEQFFLLKIFYITLERIIANFTDVLIAVSFENVKKGLENKIGKKNKYKVIHSGIDIKKFTQISINKFQKKKEIGLKENSYIIGMIAPFKPQKAPLDFVKLAYKVTQILNNVEFVLIGDGKLRKKIENEIKKLKLEKNLHLLGWRYDIAELLYTFDIFVLTSYWEGLPRVFIEAFACKIPIVATNVDGAKEVIKPTITGFVVKPKDIIAMKNYIITLLKDENLRKKLGENGNKLIQTGFNIEEMVEEIEDLYLEHFK